MMRVALMQCHPWDFEIEGVDEVLGRIAGELGLDAVSVAVVHRDARQLRPRGNPPGVSSFCTSAGAAFQPDATRYGNSRLRPAPAGWLKSRGLLRRISEAARRHRLALRWRVSCCESDMLVARHPFAACVNFLGDASDRRLCPAHPEVRQYLSGLVDDLSTNHPAEAIELEEIGFGPLREGGLYDASLPCESDLDRMLLSWCFCAACRQRAAEKGVNVDELTARMREHFDPNPRLLNPSSVVATFDALCVRWPVFAAFQAVRRETVAFLLRGVRQSADRRLLVKLPDDMTLAAVEPPALTEWCDGFILGASLGAERNAEGPRSVPDPARFDIPPERRELTFACHPPRCVEGPSLVSAVHAASRAGGAAIRFADYGTSPEPCLEWVRQAVRFARRESTKN